MEIRLIVTNGKHAGTEIPVETAEFLIGRDAECQLRPGSSQVSRKHCSIIRNDDGVFVRDFNSRNGTFVNNQRVQDQHKLKTGDRLRIGSLEMEVRLRTTVGGKKKSAIHSIQEAAARTVTEARHEDLDVSEWITRQDEVLGDEDTVSLPELMASARTKPEDEVKEDFTNLEGETPEQRRSVLFRSNQGTSKPAASSSRQAAADILRQMFGNKQE